MAKEVTDTYLAVPRSDASAGLDPIGSPAASSGARPLLVIDAARIPSPPERFRPVRAVGHFDAAARAEVRSALDELNAVGPALGRDLGRFVPEARQGLLIQRRMESIRAGHRKAAALLAYYEEMEDLVCHEAMAYLRPIRRELIIRAEHEPRVIERFPSTMALDTSPRPVVLPSAPQASEEDNDAPVIRPMIANY